MQHYSVGKCKFYSSVGRVLLTSGFFRSFFQSVCVLGYCTFPLVVSAILKIFLGSQFFFGFIVLGAYAWCIFGKFDKR